MKVNKWVDFGQEVEVDITAGDISAALAEAFGLVTDDPLGEEVPNRNDIIRALNSMAAFLNALTDQQIGMLKPAQRDTVQKFLFKAALRFALGTKDGPTVGSGDKSAKAAPTNTTKVGIPEPPDSSRQPSAASPVEGRVLRLPASAKAKEGN